MTLPRPWRTLRGRLALGFLAGLLVAAAIFAAVGSGLIRSRAERSARDELDRQAKNIGLLVSDRAEESLQAGREPSFKVANLEAFVGEGARLYYNGLPLAPGNLRNPAGGLPPAVASQISLQTLARDGVQRIDFRPPGASRPSQASAAPVVIGGIIFGSIVLTKPKGEFGSGLNDVLRLVLVAAGLGLAVALALVLVLTSRVTRPLREMERATDRVARGDLTITLERGGPEELDHLAAAFNGMVRELAERDATARDFLMRVTHDLRTPLTAIRGHAAALADGIVPPAEVPRSLAAVEAEAERLETLVSDLLDLAKMDAHRFRLELDEVDPAELLTQAFDAFAAEAARRGVTFGRSLDGLPATVVTDGGRVRQIVANLLDNALRWTPEGGSVRLEATGLPGGGMRVAVADTGPGVPEAERDAIFEPFRSTTTPDGRQGSGLGLAVGRQLARALGGDLGVDCGAEGGSCFVLRLPARVEQPAPALAASTTAGKPLQT
jgi:two-component system sensor histidine kinase BaeS